MGNSICLKMKVGSIFKAVAWVDGEIEGHSLKEMIVLAGYELVCGWMTCALAQYPVSVHTIKLKKLCDTLSR